MDPDKEVAELKERLAMVESKLQQKSRFSKGLKFAVGFIVVVMLLLVTIGIIQFITSSST